MLFKPPFTDSLKGAKVWKHYRNMHCTSELCFLSIFIFGHRPNIKVFIKIHLIFNKTINFIWLKTILNEFLWWFMLGRVLLIVIKSWYLISAAKLLCGHTVLHSLVIVAAYGFLAGHLLFNMKFATSGTRCGRCLIYFLLSGTWRVRLL